MQSPLAADEFRINPFNKNEKLYARYYSEKRGLVSGSSLLDSSDGTYLNNSSHGFKPVCFLNAVEKWDIDE